MARKALGKAFSPAALETAIKRMAVDFDKMEKSSKTVKKSKYKLKGKKTGTATMSVKHRGELGYNDIFKWSETGLASLDRVFKLFVDDLANDLKGKGRTWAIETRAMMREVSPILTGNLRDSVKILSADNPETANAISERLEMTDKNRQVTYIVGISEKDILPPPFKKHIIRGSRKGQMKVMANYNYAEDANSYIVQHKSEGYQGYDFLAKWQEIAKRNMERIFR